MHTIGKLCFIVLLVVNWASSLTALAQNLVPNPGFEEFKNCPGGFNQSPEEFRVPHWESASLGTPDHFHTCSIGEADVPYNWAGVSQAFEGNGYAGIYTWMGGLEYREYLQCKLIEPLKKDSAYVLEFHFKLSSYSKYAVDRIGLLLNDSALDLKHYKVLRCPPTLSVVLDSALTPNTGLWESARMEYKAHGGEQFLTIGNFFDNASTRNYEIQFRPISEDMLKHSAYYYIDDVKVIPRYLPVEQLLVQLVPEFSLENLKPNKNYVLRNIRFAYDSHSLTPSSFDELKQVANFLNNNPGLSVQVFGHTDDQGSEPYNLRLSVNRAMSASAYLISQGIGKSRVETFGYGKTQPLIEGKSEEARTINRRVEIRFVD